MAEGGEESDPAWALTLVRNRTLLRRGVLRTARGALGQLEAEFQEAEGHPTEESLRLAEGWRRLDVAVKLGRHQDKAAQEKCEKSAAEAKEVFESALQEANVADKCREEAEARTRVL